MFINHLGLFLLGMFCGGAMVGFFHRPPSTTGDQVFNSENTTAQTTTSITPCCNGNLEAICYLLCQFHIMKIDKDILYRRVIITYLLHWIKCSYICIENNSIHVMEELPSIVPVTERQLFWTLRGKMCETITAGDLMKNIEKGSGMLEKWEKEIEGKGQSIPEQHGLISVDQTDSPQLTIQGLQAVNLFRDHIEFLKHKLSVECPGNQMDWNSYLGEAILLGFAGDLAQTFDSIDPLYFFLEWGYSFETWEKNYKFILLMLFPS